MKKRLNKVMDYGLIVLLIVAAYMAIKNYSTIQKILKTREYANTLQIGDVIPSIECVGINVDDKLKLTGNMHHQFIIAFGVCPVCFKEIPHWNTLNLHSAVFRPTSG